ncbi:hypothetical protein DFH07DRAFT_1060442 [Mycena maculata]|uniref:Fungal-type protein kinase domain-containing protein n=1 Tax=Mycena maculata TaxID=230809 RepID=A0AAD7NE13_9AGAR|nr:hypothetical protein DFH07DRAFT_1060442 [Mycena maculata]
MGDMDIDLGPTPPSVPQIEKVTLENAPSVVDLLDTVRDLVFALKHLFLQQKILHKHLGYENVLIQRSADDGIKGLVIDLDFPNPTEGSSRDPYGYNTCRSFVFQSQRQLSHNGNAGHKSSFDEDLESLFYVLCWACYGYDHTGRRDKYRPAWMVEWIKTKYASDAASIKHKWARQELSFHVNRYMGCQRDIMEDVINQLRLVIYGTRSSDPEKVYTAILKILESGIATAEHEQCGTANKCPKAASALGLGTYLDRGVHIVDANNGRSSTALAANSAFRGLSRLRR